MRAVVWGSNGYWGDSIAALVGNSGFEVIKVESLDAILAEMRQSSSVAIIDLEWVLAQDPGTIKQIAVHGKTSGCEVLCVCPDQEEDLREIARLSRADEVFSRFELGTRFQAYLEKISEGRTAR